MVVTVLLAPQEEFLLVPGQECDGVLRLDILGMGLVVKRLDAVTCHCIVCHKIHHVLVAVTLHHVNDVSIGVPRDIGEIAIGGISGLEIDRVARGHIEHAHPHEMGGLTRHGVLFGSGSSNHMGTVV